MLHNSPRRPSGITRDEIVEDYIFITGDKKPEDYVSLADDKSLGD